MPDDPMTFDERVVIARFRELPYREPVRACGRRTLAELGLDDLTTFDRDLHHLAGVPYVGVLT